MNQTKQASNAEKRSGMIWYTTQPTQRNPFKKKQDPDVKANYRIDSVLCLVDAKNILNQLQRKVATQDGTVNEAVQQLAFADSVIVNKTDLVSAEELAAVKEKINSVNAFAKVVQSQKVSGLGVPGSEGQWVGCAGIG